jgi:hypothetical protein
MPCGHSDKTQEETMEDYTTEGLSDDDSKEFTWEMFYSSDKNGQAANG